MAISRAVFLECATNVLDNMRRKNAQGVPFHFPTVRNFIYYMLTTRDVGEKIDIAYDAFFKARDAEYQRHIFGVRFAHAASSPFGEWMDVAYVDSVPKKNAVVGFFKITHKEFFTFVPRAEDYDGIYSEMLRFIDCLPIISDRLHALNLQHHDDIHMKVPGDLRQLLRHTDSLVVHYRDINLRTRIRDVVLTVFQERGIDMRRSIRADSGFDFEHVTTGAKMSHSLLIAELITYHLKEKEAEFRGMQPYQLAVWLEAEVATISRWDIAKLMNALRRCS